MKLDQVWPHLQYNALAWLSDANVFCRISARGSVSLALFRYSDIDVSLRWYAERRYKIPENRGAVRKAITSTEIGSCVQVCRFSFEFRFVSLRLSPFLSLYSSSSPFLILASWTSFSRRHVAAGLHTLGFLCYEIFRFSLLQWYAHHDTEIVSPKMHDLIILPNISKNISTNIFAIQISFSMLGNTHLTFIPRTTFCLRKPNVVFDPQNDARNTALIFQTHFYSRRSSFYDHVSLTSIQ